MPELPEVETVRRGLEGPLLGRLLVDVEQRRPDLRWPLPERFAERLEGRRVERLDRRGKYILARLDDGWTWLVHLGMSGRMFIDAGGNAPPGPHDHVLLRTDGGHRVTFQDHRRFGMMDLVATAEAERHPLLRGMGPEPLAAAFDGPALAARLAGRMTPIKAALLDQKTVAGLGNIYVSEALFRAGIAPRRLAGTVSGGRADRLAEAIRAVLLEAIEAGGSTLRDYVQTSGELGYFQHSFRVYDREGGACPRCARTVRRIVQSGRSTFYCGGCQR